MIELISVKEKIRLLHPKNLFNISKKLGFREKVFVFSLVIIVLAFFVGWVGYIYVSLTDAVPKKGGEYAEGIVGQPMYINPLLSQTSDADSDLERLIFNGLFKYDKEGNIVNDLAESYEISEDGKVYAVRIKKDVKWHDGESLTAEDVVFTVNVVQDPAYKSPLRQNWQGVEVTQKDSHTVEFALKNPYFGFLRTLTVGILPKHVWENITPEKFSLADYNLRPIGSGPYQFIDFQKDSSGNVLLYSLKSFKDYFDGQAYISKINVNFYPDDSAMIAAYNKKEIDGMGSVTPDKVDEIKSVKRTNIYEISIPRYFAVFLNETKSVPLAKENVREALAYAIDRNEIIREVLNGRGVEIYSPFLPDMKEFENEIEKYDYNPEKAGEILDENGWELGEGEIRENGGVELEIEIFTTDWSELAQTADILAEQWKKIGVSVGVNVLAISDLQQNYIRPREYDSLLFGQALSFNPDPYFFWHSTQKKDPGLNLALFDDENADKLLSEAREELDEGKRIEKYKEFQKILADEMPAIFLYSPYYLYPVNKKVKGIEMEGVNNPSWRFADVNKWYVKTKRVWKR